MFGGLGGQKSMLFAAPAMRKLRPPALIPESAGMPLIPIENLSVFMFS